VAFYPLAELFGGALSLFTEHLRSRFEGRFHLSGLRVNQELAVGTSLTSLGLALVANPLCRGRGKRTMRQKVSYIGNPGSWLASCSDSP